MTHRHAPRRPARRLGRPPGPHAHPRRAGGPRACCSRKRSPRCPLTLPSHSTILSGLEPPQPRRARQRHLRRSRATCRPLATLLKAARLRHRRPSWAPTCSTAASAWPAASTLYDDASIGARTAAACSSRSAGASEVAARAVAWIGQQHAVPSSPGFTSTTPTLPTIRPPPFRERHPGVPTMARWPTPMRAWAASWRPRGSAARAGASAGGRARRSRRIPGRARRADPRASSSTSPRCASRSSLAGPGVPQGERRPGPARTADLLPTLARPPRRRRSRLAWTASTSGGDAERRGRMRRRCTRARSVGRRCARSGGAA